MGKLGRNLTFCKRNALKSVKSCTLAFLALLFTVAVQGRMADYPYVLVSADRNIPDIPDSTFYRIARKVTFPVNEWAIPDTSDFARELREEILPEARRQGLSLASIMMRGAASPEGPRRFNTILAERRLHAVLDLIRADLPQVEDDSISTRGSIPEDYPYLVRLMREAADPDLHTVDSLVTLYINTDVPRLKRELVAVRGSALWWRLHRQYFPALRTTHIILVFRRPDTRELVTHDHVKPVTPAPVIPSEDEGSVTPPAPVIPSEAGESERLPRRELISVKTNVLMDFAYLPGYDGFCPMPNVAIEIYPRHGHFTYGASFDCPWWQGNTTNHKYFQVRNYQVESRYYFRTGDVNVRGYGNSAAYRGWYLQAYGHLALFGIGFGEKRGWQGEGGGAGLGAGYVLPISRDGHWRLEFGLQAGWFRCKYDPYQYNCPVDPEVHNGQYYYKWEYDADLFRRRQHRWTWLGPTRVGITLSYDILYRKRDARGTSFRKWEKTK